MSHIVPIFVVCSVYGHSNCKLPRAYAPSTPPCLPPPPHHLPTTTTHLPAHAPAPPHPYTAPTTTPPPYPTIPTPHSGFTCPSPPAPHFQPLLLPPDPHTYCVFLLSFPCTAPPLPPSCLPARHLCHHLPTSAHHLPSSSFPPITLFPSTPLPPTNYQNAHAHYFWCLHILPLDGRRRGHLPPPAYHTHGRPGTGGGTCPPRHHPVLPLLPGEVSYVNWRCPNPSGRTCSPDHYCLLPPRSSAHHQLPPCTSMPCGTCPALLPRQQPGCHNTTSHHMCLTLATTPALPPAGSAGVCHLSSRVGLVVVPFPAMFLPAGVPTPAALSTIFMPPPAYA